MQFTDDTAALRSAPPEAVADALGLTPDPITQKKKGGAGYLYFRTPADEPIVVCAKSRAGAPLWWRQGDAGHAQDWLGLVQHLRPGLDLGHAKSFLRRALGSSAPRTPAPSPSPLPTPAPLAPPAPPTLTTAPDWTAAWLTGRGLSADAIRTAMDAGMGGVSIETQSGASRLNLAFPHTNSNSDLIGAEIRGHDRSFKGFRGQKGVFLLPPQTSSERLCVVESAIDALALLDFMRQHGKGPAWIISTAGRPSAEQIDEIEAFARDLGITRLIAAQDADDGGAAQAEIVEAMAGRMGAEYKRTKPPAGCKDWADWAERRAA